VAGIFCQKQLFNARFLGFAFLYSLVRRIKYLIYQVLALPIIKFHSEECGWGLKFNVSRGEKGQADVNFKISACHLATQKAVGLRGRDGYHFIFIQTHDV